jgi:NAD(P)H-hydrate epimerase
VYYPKQSKNDLYQRLSKQLKDLDVPFTEDFHSALQQTDHVVDAIFGKLYPINRVYNVSREASVMY